MRLAGGTLVTPYGAQRAAQAAGTWSIGVVLCTDAQGPAAALGRVGGVGVGRAVTVGAAVGPPQDDRVVTAKATAAQPGNHRINTRPSLIAGYAVPQAPRPAQPTLTSLASRPPTFNHSAATTAQLKRRADAAT